jgi:uncharacterized protein with von Willebrand factor type A (vWA) domain
MDDSSREDGATGNPIRKAGPPATSLPTPPNLEKRVTSLAAALRRARVDHATRAEAVGDLRTREIARLEVLREALEPILAQLPQDCDLFDVAISPGDRPRLFVDHIGYVEMSHDRHTFRFLQDTRHGRIEVCENDDPEVLVEGITTYIAHRLIEREKALAADYASGTSAAAAARAVVRAKEPERPAPPQPTWGVRAMQVYLFLIEFIGAVLTFGLLALLGLWLYRRAMGQ